jgi:hypothetical protein
MSNLNSFSLYLAKAGSTGFDDLLTQNARDMVKGGAVKKLISGKFAEGHRGNPIYQLKSIFAKTDTHRQCALVALLLQVE